MNLKKCMCMFTLCALIATETTVAQSQPTEYLTIMFEALAALPTGVTAPGGEALYDVFVVYRLSFNEAPAPPWNSNLAAEIQLTMLPSGMTVSWTDAVFFPMPPDPLLCASADCTSCGPVLVNGALNSLLCNSNCTTCDHLITSQMRNVPLPPTSGLHVRLKIKDKIVGEEMPFPNSAVYWDRALKSGTAKPVPGRPRAFDIEVEVELWRQYAGKYDLSFRLLLVDSSDVVVAQTTAFPEIIFAPNVQCNGPLPPCAGPCLPNARCDLNFHYPGYPLGCSCLELLEIEAFSSVSLEAGVDYYLKIDSIDGESQSLPNLAPFAATKTAPLVLPAHCPSDLDGDGAVGVGDLLQLLACWGPVEPGSECKAADLTSNDNVGVADLLDLLSQWGPCP